ncbi:hypothetical protein IE53DRAFT_385681 [Violaceomyces palustris]|uniref:Uncharacterized protein n=1 Tax=Violaceomyces palustris TaxID=1673888 RepID=A0ACD0P1H0_9BASI|nr:hypothetical protein IE53DRAFT_385681 [Violaceomyces palustris]
MVKDYSSQLNYDFPWSSCVRAYFLRYPNPSASHVLSVDVLDRRIEYRNVVPTSTSSSPSPPPSSSSSSSSFASSVISNSYPPSSTRSGDPLPTTPPQSQVAVLCTTRLILKRGTLPSWAPQGLIKNAESWVLEESEVELDPHFPSSSAASSSYHGQLDAPPELAMSDGRNMRVWTRNLDHTTVLAVTEGLRFREKIQDPKKSAESLVSAPVGVEKGKGKSARPILGQPVPLVGTEFKSEVKGSSGKRKAPSDPASLDPGIRNWCATINTGQVESGVGFGLLRRRIENFGMTRFIAHRDTSNQGLLWTLSHLDPSLLPSLHLTPYRSDKTLSGKARLLAALRPPFLDGYPLSPLQRLSKWFYSTTGRTPPSEMLATESGENEGKPGEEDWKSDIKIREERWKRFKQNLSSPFALLTSFRTRLKGEKDGGNGWD